MTSVAVLPVTVVNAGYCRVVKRFGVISRVLTCGLNVVNPLLDSYVAVDWSFDAAGSRVTGVDIPMHSLRYDPKVVECTTRDQIAVGVNVLVEFRVVDVVRAVTNTPNLFASVETLVAASLLEAVRSLPLAEVTPRVVQGAVSKNLDEASGTYGIELQRVFIESLDIPKEIRTATVAVEAARRQRMAELDKLQQESEIKLSQQRLKLELTQAAAIEEQLVSANEAKKRKAEALAAVEVADLQLQQELKRERLMRELDLEMYGRKLAALRDSRLPTDVTLALARCDALTALGKDPATKLVLAAQETLDRQTLHLHDGTKATTN